MTVKIDEPDRHQVRPARLRGQIRKRVVHIHPSSQGRDVKRREGFRGRDRFSRSNYASEEKRRAAMLDQLEEAAENLQEDDEDREALQSVQDDFDAATSDGLGSW